VAKNEDQAVPKLQLTLALVAMLLLPGRSFAVTPMLAGEVVLLRVKLSECFADVKEVTGWDEAQTMTAARQVCEVRQKHLKQKQRFVKALEKLQQQYKGYTNHGLEQHVPNATKDSWSIVKSCIDFKQGFTYPHNIGTLTVPATIHQECYQMGAKLVEAEIQRFGN
jgi:hypothetical protein